MIISKKILLIEDSLTQAAQFRFHFEKLGYEIEIANDGKSGLKKLEAYQPDLIVLDLLLPGELDGLAVCRAIKGNPANPQIRTIPVLMFSGENKLNLMNEAYRSGADYYVVKAHDGLKTLQTIIEAAFARRARMARRETAAPRSQV
jgi:two-component system, OmpR family, phosphate regulon response regulator PhoB